MASPARPIQNGRRIVMVVAGLSSFNERIAASVDFMNWGFNAWQGIPLVKAGKVAGQAKVAGGAEIPEVAMVAARDLFVTVPRGTGSDRKTKRCRARRA